MRPVDATSAPGTCPRREAADPGSGSSPLATNCGRILPKQGPGLGRRRPALEERVFPDLRQGEELLQRPADPQVLLETARTQARARVSLLIELDPIGRRELIEVLPGQGLAGRATRRMMSATQAGARCRSFRSWASWS